MIFTFRITNIIYFIPIDLLQLHRLMLYCPSTWIKWLALFNINLENLFVSVLIFSEFFVDWFSVVFDNLDASFCKYIIKDINCVLQVFQTYKRNPSYDQHSLIRSVFSHYARNSFINTQCIFSRKHTLKILSFIFPINFFLTNCCSIPLS